jgi:uncharacterized protein (TIGR00299 family) protein
MPSENWAFLDLPTGVAGDMILAALFDQGLPESVVLEPLHALGLNAAFRLNISQAKSAGLRGTKLVVELLEESPPHRLWRELRPQLEATPWPKPLREKVLTVFNVLAQAEALVHGVEPEQVHFHEVGAIDALVDVVGVCAGLLHLGLDYLLASAPPAGHGVVNTAHGLLPVPVPAVMEIAKQGQIPLASSVGFPPGELTTPTGIALLKVWVKQFTPPPAHIPSQVGVGLGHRSLDRPNLVRFWQPLEQLSELDPAGAKKEMLLVQQCQVDDMDGESIGFLQEQLREAGAWEVFNQPIQMKKGRPGVLVTCLAPPEFADNLRAIWWQHSSSLGLRERIEPRWVLPRQAISLQSPWGPVMAKQSMARVKLEADELSRLAKENGLSWHQIKAAIGPIAPAS